MQSIWQQLSKEISDRVAHAGRSIVAIESRGWHASSGIVWRPGFVLTAMHAVRQDSKVGIIGESGEIVTAHLVGRAAAADVALLKLDHDIQAVPAEFGPTDGLAVGELVVAIARTRRGNIVASSGILSGLMGEWQAGRMRVDQFIRPDLTLYSGFSGGALIGADGKILGMTAGGILRGKPLTIPATTLVRAAEELLAKGHVSTPFVGLVMQPVPIPDSLQKLSGANASVGLLVMHVEPGGPSDVAGVFVGDIIVDLDGHPCGDLEDLQSILRQRGVNQELKIGLIRGGQRKNLSIKIGERPLR